jgi:phosphoribosylformylglycinamidine (FGAM) synthase-like amidotransferase family enzyme
MPHPERAIDTVHPSQDGMRLFRGLVSALADA